MAYYVNEEGILEMKQNWECMYGILDKGTYSINVNIETDKYVKVKS